MALPTDLNPHFLASSAGYQIERSLRFNSADTAYLSRTPGSASNRRTFTWSGWIKRGLVDANYRSIFCGYSSSTVLDYLIFYNDYTLGFRNYNGTSYDLLTTQVFRDASAWYHIVLAVDSTQATSSNRVKIYINGSQITAFGTATYPSLNYDFQINNNVSQYIGYNGFNYIDGYMTEVNFIDGQQLTPSSFGETDSATGTWKPKKYTGTYGTNGFYLKFADNSGTTSTTLGKDSSGNGNNWTPNNFSVATVSSIVYEIDGAGSSENGGFSYYIKVSGAGTVNLTANGGGGNLSGPTFTGISTLNGNLNDWGNSIVRKNGAYLFAVAGGRVTNDSGSQVATQARSANSVTQTGVSVADGDILSIDFGVNSSVTAYYWYPNAPKFSVTAANGASLVDVTNDSSVDTPTSYGIDTGVGNTVRGNYCTWNPLSTIGFSLSNGNLDVTGSTTSNRVCKGTFAVSSGKWYWEITNTVLTTSSVTLGICSANATYSSGVVSTGNEVAYYGDNGNKYVNGSASAYGASYKVFDVIGIALDLDGNTVTFYKNGTSQGSISITSGITWVACWTGQGDTNDKATANFGQRPFAYTAPSGFKALCTQNLPTPTIGATSTTQAGKYFNPVLYTGNGGTAQDITGVGFQPDFVWLKSRNSASFSHRLYDAVRGAGNELYSNSTSAESTVAQSLTAFISDGFSLGTDLNNNQTSTTYVAWNWNAGGSTVTNTSGTITSSVRASTTAGFSIVTYTGTGVNATVGHGLGVVPSMIIAKRRSATQNWGVWHTSLTGTQTLYLDLTQGVTTAVWNGTPTSTVFNITTDGVVNTSTSTYVAYCFAPVAGYSAFGSYTGNGAGSGSGTGDGPFVYTGFRPRWIMVKVISGTTANWSIIDTARDTYNFADNELWPSSSAAEQTYAIADILSNGFKLRSDSGQWNSNGAVYIYAAFAENPFKYSLAR